MASNTDNPAGMSTLWLKSRVNQLSRLVDKLRDDLNGHSQQIAGISSSVNALWEIGAEALDRISALEDTVWQHIHRPALIARLQALSIDADPAAEFVDTYGPDDAPGKTDLAEGLATLRYTPTEILECIEDVPALTQADIDYAKAILDAWDPATTSLKSAYLRDTRMVIFPKLDTSNVTNMEKMLRGCTRLAYVPQLDTSHVTAAGWAFGYDRETTAIKRLKNDTWPALNSCYGPFCGMPNLETVPEEVDLSSATFLCVAFAFSRIPSGFRGIRLRTDSPVQLDQLFTNATIVDGKLPMTDFPDNVTRLTGIYGNTYLTGSFADVTIRARGVTNGPGNMFTSSRFSHAPQLDMPQANSFESLFCWNHNLEVVPDYTGIAPEKINQMLRVLSQHAGYLRRVEGLNYARVADSGLFGSTRRNQAPQLTYMRIINLGQGPSTTYDFESATAWGTGTEADRRSIVDSLLTDSFDRAAAGMPPAAITISPASLAVLTSEEVAAITAKGYTIASVTVTA